MPTSTAAVTHFAGRAGDHNDRAMAASPALAAELAARVGGEVLVVGRPAAVLDAGWDVELDAARPALAAMAERYATLLAAGQRPVTASSRCAVALATLPAVVRRHPDAVVVWFDAHADLNTPGTSTTGYLGGLALAGPLGLWDSGFGAGLARANVVLAGVRDLDPAEQDLVDHGGITAVAPGPGFATRLAAAVAGREAYVHIDCDVLEPGLVPTDYEVPGGLTLEDLRTALAALSTTGVVGLEVGELEADRTPDLTAAAVARIVDAVQPVLTSLRR